jgi:aromatic-L-amino-acid/L-tryptophan decarboxylase
MNKRSSTPPPPSELGDMPAEEFRQYGHQLIDWIADFFSNINDLAAFPDVQPGDILNKLPTAPPRWF